MSVVKVLVKHGLYPLAFISFIAGSVLLLVDMYFLATDTLNVGMLTVGLALALGGLILSYIILKYSKAANESFMSYTFDALFWHII